MAFTAVTALVAGAEVTTALVLTAVAEVGLAMTVVGAVTGSKSLMKVGAVLGLVGGIGGMIAGASGGAAAVGAETMESAAGLADAAYGGAAGMEASQLAGIEAMGGSSLQSSMGVFEATDLAGMVNEAQQTAFGAVDQTVAAGEVVAPTQTEALIGVNEPIKATNDVYGNLNATKVAEPVRQNLAPNVQDLIEDPALKVQGDSINALDAHTGVSYGSTGAVDQKTWFTKIMTWAKENEKLATAGATLLSGGLSGMGQMKQAEMQQEQNKMRYGYGNQVANFKGYQPKPLIGVA